MWGFFGGDFGHANYVEGCKCQNCQYQGYISEQTREHREGMMRNAQGMWSADGDVMIAENPKVNIAKGQAPVRILYEGKKHLEVPNE